MLETKINFLSVLAQSNLLDSIPCAVFLKDTESRFIGCNKFLANLAGFPDGDAVIGKTDDEMPWADELTHYHAMDQTVMKNEITVEEIETIQLHNKKITAKTTKAPLYYQGKIIGIIGCFFDITEMRKNENELKTEKEKAETTNASALQVAHDIRSPLAAIMMLTEACAAIPEAQRICLREAAGRIQDIANQLLIKHGKEERPIGDDKQPLIMVSTALLSVISSKRVEHKRSKIKLNFESTTESYFAFIEADVTEFKRMISNMINNSIEAFDCNPDEVRITLNTNESHLIINIIDTGRGMSEEKIQEILSDNNITTQKATGFGLGLTHAKKMLRKCNAKLNIYSSCRGTTMELIFHLMPTSPLIANEINLSNEDCIVVLDDDQSIHGAWDEVFSHAIEKNFTIKLMHFTHANECVDHINSYANPEKILLLTDYELIAQPLNGLDVIEKTKVKRAILVTSHYENQQVIKRAESLNTKILPKMLASHVKVIVHKEETSENKNLTTVDLILLDDSTSFTAAFSWYYSKSKNKTVKAYNSPYTLLEEIALYPKHTKICTDYTLDTDMTGVDVAKILHERGYTHLYLSTGHRFKQEDLPDYLQLLNGKDEICNL